MTTGHGNRLPPFVQKHGKGYRGWVSDGGRQRRGPTFPTPAEAYEWAHKEREAGSSTSGQVSLERAMTLVRRELELAERREGTSDWYECQFAALLREWPRATQLSRIGKREVERFIARRREAGASGGTIRHHLRALSRLFSVCRRAGLVRGDSPTTQVTLPRASDALPRRLRFDEVESVVLRARAAGASADADLLEFLFRTGIRRTEAAWVRFDDIAGGELHVRHGKRRPRVLPVPADLERLVRRLASRGGEWIVSGASPSQRAERVSRACSRWRLELAEPRLAPHALRHSFATHLARKGIAEHVIAALLGHRPASMTTHYIGVPIEQAMIAMEAVWKA